MKLRIDSQTLRLRLLPEDVAELARSGRVVGALVFPANGSARLDYELVVSAAFEVLSARFDGGRMTVSVPQDAAHSLIETELVGIEERVPVDGGSELLVVVEKDLKPRRPAPRREA